MLYRYGIHLLTLILLGHFYVIQIWYNLDNKVEIAVGFGHNWAYEQEFVYALFYFPFIVEKGSME